MALKTTPETVLVGGNPLKCLLCSHDTFHRRRTHFETALSKDLNPDWQDRVGYCLICHQCGYIHWFVDRPIK